MPLRKLCHTSAALLFTFATVLVQPGAAAPLLQAAPPAAPQTAAGPAADLVRQARQLNNQGKQDEALALVRKALETDPSSFDAHLTAGVVLDLKGDYAEARKHLAKALELAPAASKQQALTSMAMSYAFERKGKEAAKFEQQAFDARLAAQDFTGAAERANEQARISLESGDIDDAHKWYKLGYETALRKSGLPPAEKDLWDFRWEHAQARIAARRGKRDEALKHVAAAKAALDKGTNPEQARFFPYLAGYVAFYGGDYKTALAELQKADQRDPFILGLIAQTCEKLGDQNQAMEYYRKVLASNAHNPTNAFARPLARKKLGK